MINPDTAESVHKILIGQFGGSHSVRDHGSLKSALLRPYQTFDGNELYPGPIEKAAALIESILRNHPFVDGNKRTGYVLMRILLIEHGFDITATQDEKYEFVIQIAAGSSDFGHIVHWLKNHTKENNH